MTPRLRSLVAGLVLAVLVLPCAASDFVMDPARSKLTFRAVAENAEFGGEFARFSSSARFDPAQPAASRIEASVDLASVDTANGQRDELLVGSEWFATSRFPRAGFVTRRITPRAAPGMPPGQAFRAEAELSLRGVTRPVVMDLTWVPDAQRRGAVLRGSVPIRRLDFGVGQGDWANTRYIADGVVVEVDVHYVAAPTAAATP